jgi:hypothetical protein
MRTWCSLVALCLLPGAVGAAAPVYLWYEPEWFEGVEGSFAYWTGEAKPAGHWAVAGPGISPEWTQGGESEWNSTGVPAAETKAECHRDLVIPRTGRYRAWVRYAEHRKKKTPFTVAVDQAGKSHRAELGVTPVVPVNDEYQLYWGFSFGWASFDAELASGPARLGLVIDKPGEAWRQVDAVLLTDDLAYVPVGREKPPFAYFAAANLRPTGGPSWRGSGRGLKPGAGWSRPKVGGRDFSMWTTIELDPKWWKEHKGDELPEVFRQLSSPPDIRKPFLQRYPSARDTPLVNWPHLLPGVYLGNSPDLSPGTPLRQWLERTRTPFFILTNYANPTYTAQTGAATYAALTGPLAGQFLGYVHGEAVGTSGVALPQAALGKTRAEHLAALRTQLLSKQAAAWTGFYKTPVPEAHWARGISCLSVDSIALSHLFHDMGSRVVGYEEDSTNYHVPMRIAFERGAARQYGGAWINYASGNFGDSCNYFTQEPRVPRGAKSWFHSKYAVTDGVTAGWYRRLYYLNYLAGASAVFWEQGLENQWILPGPGTHPVQLSPFGRATEDFMDFVGRLPDRGEPYTPVAVLLSHAHGYEPVNYSCKMLQAFRESPADRELRELFNVLWYPSALAEGQPAAPDVQSMPGGAHGNVFDVLVDRPARARAIFDYPVVWAGGDVDLGGTWPAVLEEYVKKGGTLVVNVEAARALPPALVGLRPAGKTVVAQEWRAAQGERHEAVPFEVALVRLDGAKVLAWAAGQTPLITRHAVGEGAVIVTLAPRMLGQDERAHPALPYLLNGLTAGLMPVEVRRADGRPLGGEVLWQLNRTKDGWLVLLANNRGVDKTPNGVARVDRRAFADVQVRCRGPVKSATEYTGPRDLTTRKDGDTTVVGIRVHPGDVQVVYLTVR